MWTIFWVAVTAGVMLTGRDRSIKIMAGLFFAIGLWFAFADPVGAISNMIASL